jgi:ATP-dependent Zn protease
MSDLTALAVHEAGHAVVARALGADVTGIAVAPERGEGWCVHTRRRCGPVEMLPGSSRPYRRSGPPLRRRVEATIAVAGRVAESIYLGRDRRSDADFFLDRTRAVARALPRKRSTRREREAAARATVSMYDGGSDVAEAMVVERDELPAVVAAAREIIERHWDDVEAIAACL